MQLHPLPYDHNLNRSHHLRLLQVKSHQNKHAHQFAQELGVATKYHAHQDWHSIFQFLPIIVLWWFLLAILLLKNPCPHDGKHCPSCVHKLQMHRHHRHTDWPRPDWPRPDWPHTDWPRPDWPRADWPHTDWPRPDWP